MPATGRVSAGVTGIRLDGDDRLLAGWTMNNKSQFVMFTDRGYISYHGTMSLEELMMEDLAETYRQEQGFQMGGMA